MIVWKTGITLAMALFTIHVIAQPNVQVVDKRMHVAGNMLAYTEFELSGEPLAEALGLDLDTLDPNALDQPTAFDYATGIESYEYSEEAMYALNFQSTMGPHLANGLLNATRGGSLQSLGQRMVSLAAAVAFPAEEIPLNLYPISFPYQSGLPELAQPADTTPVNSDEVEGVTRQGKTFTSASIIPAYYRDYKTLAWSDQHMDKTVNPGALGTAMLKDVMWSQDFLGGMHTTAGNEEVDAKHATMDHSSTYALGVSAPDGMNGMILTEMIWDRLLTLQQRFGYDGKQLGASITPQYSAQQPIWFPHQIQVIETTRHGLKAIDQLKVTDSRSTLRDTWQLLWPLSEFFAFSDQRLANRQQNPAFLAVFDGAPFAATPAQNKDNDPKNDVLANDPFSLASNLSHLVFENLATLHFNTTSGVFVDEHNGTQQGQHVTTYDVAYSLVALSIFQRAQDALPVGYGSAEGNTSLATPQGKRALQLIESNANFILTNLIDPDGLVAVGYTLNKGVDAQHSLDAQFATIRGLVAAFLATQKGVYKEAARRVFLAAEKHQFDKALGTYATQPGQPTTHTPYTAAAISAGLRETMLHLKNEAGETQPEFKLQHLTQRYQSWFRLVINGPATNQGMQLSEWLGDSGEHMLKSNATADSDGDNVAKVPNAGGPFGTAQTMANKVIVTIK